MKPHVVFTAVVVFCQVTTAGLITCEPQEAVLRRRSEFRAQPLSLWEGRGETTALETVCAAQKAKLDAEVTATMGDIGPQPRAQRDRILWWWALHAEEGHGGFHVGMVALTSGLVCTLLNWIEYHTALGVYRMYIAVPRNRLRLLRELFTPLHHVVLYARNETTIRTLFADQYPVVGHAMARAPGDGIDWMLHIDDDEYFLPIGLESPGSSEATGKGTYSPRTLQEVFLRTESDTEGLHFLNLETIPKSMGEAIHLPAPWVTSAFTWRHNSVRRYMSYYNGKSAGIVRRDVVPRGAHHFGWARELHRTFREEESAAAWVLHYALIPFCTHFVPKRHRDCPGLEGVINVPYTTESEWRRYAKTRCKFPYPMDTWLFRVRHNWTEVVNLFRRKVIMPDVRTKDHERTGYYDFPFVQEVLGCSIGGSGPQSCSSVVCRLLVNRPECPLVDDEPVPTRQPQRDDTLR